MGGGRVNETGPCGSVGAWRSEEFVEFATAAPERLTVTATGDRLTFAIAGNRTIDVTGMVGRDWDSTVRATADECAGGESQSGSSSRKSDCGAKKFRLALELRASTRPNRAVLDNANGRPVPMPFKSCDAAAVPALWPDLLAYKGGVSKAEPIEATLPTARLFDERRRVVKTEGFGEYSLRTQTATRKSKVWTAMHYELTLTRTR
jgi:hypothetical protein